MGKVLQMPAQHVAQPSAPARTQVFKIHPHHVFDSDSVDSHLRHVLSGGPHWQPALIAPTMAE